MIFKEICRFKVRKNFVGQPFCVPQKILNRKKLWKRGNEGGRKGEMEGGRERGREGGIITFSVKYLMAHSTKKIVAEPFCASQNFWPRWVISQTPIENLLSQRTESFRRGILLCFRKFLALKNFRIKRGISRLSKEKICITEPKASAWNQLVCH